MSNINPGMLTNILTLSGVTGDVTTVIPAGWIIASLTIFNTTANAITGGVKIGTSGGGTDVVLAVAVGANALFVVPNATLLKQVFSTTADQTVHIAAVTAWNSANLVMKFVLQRLF